MRPILIILIVIISAVPTISQRATSSPRPKPVVAKPPATPTPAPTPDENTEFEAARKIEDASERAARLKQFLENFPDTNKRTAALELLTVALADSADLALRGGNAARAVELLEEAVDRAPDPISSRLFSEVLVKFPDLLFVNNERTAALKLATSIERRAADNPRYLLQITSFYVSIEDSEGALRTARAASEMDPASPLAHQMLGLAHRLNFDLDSAAASYAKALELAPDSRSSSQNLADIKRALGKPIEALEIYDRLIASDKNDAAARAGRVLALFDLGRKGEAEAAFDETLKLAPGNIALIGNVAYWYAANGDAANAILHAEEAIDLEPRYVWSHLALGRALMMQGRFADAEKVLTATRRFGRFPTLEYEIAKARIALGFYRDALEDVRNVFDIDNGNISAALGGRVRRTDRSFAQLLADERRASIFEPKSSTEDDLDAQLARLLAFDKALKVGDAKSVESTGRELAAGTDPMRLYRVLFTANVLLDKRLLPEVALDIVQTASSILNLN
ncbi:tetratricopeptide repeat protein [Leptolyngbya sp. 7M]|uniref:tetratricopeptide repeat protein n=1 Tax=Leptolyngbya sp. 7M TaxID=2812896 RepID=UPI001B8D428C|nr:tetratricopeptide repeat protein [Leptolyngbya sp. 7M]QYO66609.1 tetratricopeptide repeat protein [Leptolyngbya sp. 7M]